MTLDAIKRMELGQLVDYCDEWNRMHDESREETPTVTKRKATQADWDAFFC